MIAGIRLPRGVKNSYVAALSRPDAQAGRRCFSLGKEVSCLRGGQKWRSPAGRSRVAARTPRAVVRLICPRNERLCHGQVSPRCRARGTRLHAQDGGISGLRARRVEEVPDTQRLAAPPRRVLAIARRYVRLIYPADIRQHDASAHQGRCERQTQKVRGRRADKLAASELETNPADKSNTPPSQTTRMGDQP